MMKRMTKWMSHFVSRVPEWLDRAYCYVFREKNMQNKPQPNIYENRYGRLRQLSPAQDIGNVRIFVKYRFTYQNVQLLFE